MDTPGSRLRALRIDAGYTQAKLAAIAIGVPISTYSQHELAQSHLPYKALTRYAAFFKTRPEYIQYGSSS